LCIALPALATKIDFWRKICHKLPLRF